MRTYTTSFKAGQICGHYRVLRDVTGHGTDRANVKCTTCGHETRVKLFTLTHLVNEVLRGAPARSCRACQTAWKARSMKRCTRCEDQSWRRPRKGLCRCGKAFREEEPLHFDFAASRGGIGSILAGGEYHP